MATIYPTDIQLAPEPDAKTKAEYHLNEKTSRMARAIHIFNPRKLDQPTCLGRRVRCGLRCPNQIEMTALFTVLSAMVAATEDPSLRLETIDKLAYEWAKQLSCHLHKSQEGVEDAVFDGFLLYRKITLPASVTSVPTVDGQASGHHEGESSALKPKDDQSGLEEEEVELPHNKWIKPVDPFAPLKKALDAYLVEMSEHQDSFEKIFEAMARDDGTPLPATPSQGRRRESHGTAREPAQR